MQAHSGLQRLTLRTRLQRHHLHWPLLLYQRRLKLLGPHRGDIIPGWDLRPLLQYIRDHTGGPRLPSRPGYQAWVSHHCLGPSRRLLQLIRVRGPSITSLEDQAPYVQLRSDPRERRSSCPGFPHGVILRCIDIDHGPAIQRFDVIDLAVFTSPLHNAEAVLLSPGGA